MAAHSSTLAWRIPWTEEPDELWSTGSQRARHNWNDLACMEDSKGQGSQTCCIPWSHENVYEYTHLTYNWIFDKASVLAHLTETFRVSASPAFLINCFSPPAWYASQSVFYNDRSLRVWIFLCQMSSTVSQVLLNSFSSAVSPLVEYGQWSSIFSGMTFSLKHIVDKNSCSTKVSWRP